MQYVQASQKGRGGVLSLKYCDVEQEVAFTCGLLPYWAVPLGALLVWLGFRLLITI